MFETIRKNNSSVTAPGAHILLGFYDYWLFDTPKINNHSVTEPSAMIVFGDEITHSFGTHPKIKHGVTAPSAHILSGYDAMKCQHKDKTYSPGQKYLHREKSIFFFKYMVEHTMLHSVTINMHGLKLLIIIDIESLEQQFAIIKILLQSDRLKQHSVTIRIDQ